MSDRVLKSEQEKDGASPGSSGEFLGTTEKAEASLPIPTVTTSLSRESRVIVRADPRSAGADRFRLLQIRLRSIQASRKLKSILITSPLAKDGKSTVALNLATALSEYGKLPVLLLEADVHRPALIERLGLHPWPGLTECFKSKGDPMLAIRRIEPLGFYLLPAGTPADDCSDLLQTDFVSQLVGGLSPGFAWILIDAPPTTPIADILALRAQTDATLLVVRAGETPREAVEESIRNLGRDHVLGIILNGVRGLDRVYAKYYGFGDSARRAKTNTIPRE